MPTILPSLNAPAPSPVDVDSLAARQAHNLAQVAEMTANTSAAMLAGVRDTYAHTWGVPVKTKAADGTVSSDPSRRANQNNLSPAEAISSYGTGAQAAFGVYAATLAAVHTIYGDAAMIQPTTGENMTAAPAGWSVVFAPDGTATATYTAPVPPAPAPAATPAA